jgi:hypothetical protein
MFYAWERTNNSEDKGKWFVLTTAEHIETTKQYLATDFIAEYTESELYPTNMDKYNSLPSIRRENKPEETYMELARQMANDTIGTDPTHSKIINRYSKRQRIIVAEAPKANGKAKSYAQIARGPVLTQLQPTRKAAARINTAPNFNLPVTPPHHQQTGASTSTMTATFATDLENKMTTMTLNFAEEFEKKTKELNTQTDNNQRIMDGLTGRLNSIENALLSMQSTVNNTAAQITFLMSKLGGESDSLSTLYLQQKAASDESQKRPRRDNMTNSQPIDTQTETQDMQEENESE